MDCKYKVINEALADIYALRAGRKFTKVTTASDKNGEYEGSYTEYTEVYDLGVDNLHIKLVLRTDSYGDNETVVSVQIVKPIVKQITDFEVV